MNKLLSFFIIAVAIVNIVQAAQVDEAAARHVADKFFMEKSSRLSVPVGQSAIRLAYIAEQQRFYVLTAVQTVVMSWWQAMTVCHKCWVMAMPVIFRRPICLLP